MISLASKTNEIDQAWLLVRHANKILKGETVQNDYTTLNNVWRLITVYETAKAFTVPHYTGDMQKIFDDIDQMRLLYLPNLSPLEFAHLVNAALRQFLVSRVVLPEYKAISQLLCDLENCWKREADNDENLSCVL